ncbi:MAG: hypothetical protein FRX49_11243 [Trebouxia sp. A1-2]|nr:MAG: hypothetical protein FRX49_11243 [Trebouxia sp. A1-2]
MQKKPRGIAYLHPVPLSKLCNSGDVAQYGFGIAATAFGGRHQDVNGLLQTHLHCLTAPCLRCIAHRSAAASCSKSFTAFSAPDTTEGIAKGPETPEVSNWFSDKHVLMCTCEAGAGVTAGVMEGDWEGEGGLLAAAACVSAAAAAVA